MKYEQERVISEGECTRLGNNLKRKLQMSSKCDHLRVGGEKTATRVMIRLNTTEIMLANSTSAPRCGRTESRGGCIIIFWSLRRTVG